MLAVAGFLMFAQDQDLAVASAHDVHLMMIFLGVIAGVIVLVLLALLIAAIVVMGLIRRLEKVIDEVKTKAFAVVEKTTPIIDNAKDLVADWTPKIKTIGTNAEHISNIAKDKATEIGGTVTKINETVIQINQTVQDVNGRTRGQVAHVDGIVTEALNTTEHVSRTIQEGIRAPFKQMAGIFTGMKVGVETFLHRVGYRPAATRYTEPVTPPVPPPPTSRFS